MQFPCNGSPSAHGIPLQRKRRRLVPPQVVHPQGGGPDGQPPAHAVPLAPSLLAFCLGKKLGPLSLLACRWGEGPRDPVTLKASPEDCKVDDLIRDADPKTDVRANLLKCIRDKVTSHWDPDIFGRWASAQTGKVVWQRCGGETAGKCVMWASREAVSDFTSSLNEEKASHSKRGSMTKSIRCLT
jgi:hypothetical protein